MDLTLYKRNQRGAAYVWSVRVRGSTATYEWGQEGGKMQTKVREYAEGKQNRTAGAQAVFEAESVAKKKRRTGYLDSIEDADAHAREAAPLPMLATKLQDRKAPLPRNVFVQPKLDGMRCVGDTHTGALWSRKGKRFEKLDHIEGAVKGMLDGGVPPQCEWASKRPRYVDGELFIKGKTFPQISSLIRHGSPLVEYHVYDVVLDAPFRGRDEILHFAKWGGPIKFVEARSCADTMITSVHEQHVADGYEGTMVRPDDPEHYRPGARSKNLLKLKDFEDAEFECVDVKQEKHGVDNLGALELRLHEGDDRTFFARPKMTGEERLKIWRDPASVIGQQITVRYFELSKDGVPRFPVAVGVRPHHDT